jgi:flagellar biosynthetic protein FlhB
MGMKTPKVVAKGIDFIALRMKEIAQESHVPIVENVPLARKLYAEVEVDEDIHETLYKAVSEVIRYVFRLKGIKLQKSIKKSKAILHEKTEV